MSIVGKLDLHDYRVFTLMSDGECNEGSIWEPALLAPHHHLDNLVVIIDYNKIQSLARVEEVIQLDPLSEKWSAFGWAVREIDGHNFQQIESSLSDIPFERGKPSCIIAHTIKGKGVSFMEDQLIWHYYSPDEEELSIALTELELNT